MAQFLFEKMENTVGNGDMLVKAFSYFLLSHNVFQIEKSIFLKGVGSCHFVVKGWTDKRILRSFTADWKNTNIATSKSLGCFYSI